MVEEHLTECPACGDLLRRLRASEIEESLKTEKESVIEYGTRRFKRRSALAGAVISGLFMIPLFICLVVNIASGHGLGWFFIVLASLMVAASLIVVPLMAPENKGLWTLGSFCVSLLFLLATACLYTRGNWFWIASDSVLFGLGVIFLPFVVRTAPVKKLIGNANRLLIVLGLDAALFVNMMNSIFSRGAFTFRTVLLVLGTLAGAGLVVMEVLRKRRG